jgi:methionine synthase II (cobalamin-independent)
MNQAHLPYVHGTKRLHMQTATLKKFPFKSVLSLKMLIDYWQQTMSVSKLPGLAEPVLDYIRNAPELQQPIYDYAILEKHKDFVQFLMSAVIPAAQTDELIAASKPFQFQTFYATNAFSQTIDFENLDHSAQVNIPGASMTVGKTIHACLLILHKFYDVPVSFDKPILFTLRNPETGLDKVYKIEISKQFFTIIPTTEVKPIDPKIIKFLTEKVYDIDLWLQYIKPEDFEFHGFMTIRMVDVTEQEMISSIKYDLLEKNAVSQRENFSKIQHKLQSIFAMPDIRLGVAFFDPNNNIVLNSSDNTDCWKSLANDHNGAVPCDNYNGSIYERSWKEKRYIAIEDLELYPFKTPLEERLLCNGVKNILLAPLIDGEETIGMLELASPTPGKLNPITAAKVENALPMFTAAVKRVKEEMATEIRAIIQEECTNIHPTVQWRFFQAGTNLLNLRRRGEKAQLEEIVFKDVYPLFGLADVRNSSIERNKAIQEDLQQNLQMVKDLLLKINSNKKLPILEEVIFKTDIHLRDLAEGLASGDESNVLEFLKTEINPLLAHFANDVSIQTHIDRYNANLDPVFGVVYKRRKAFEESLGQINKMISSYLDEAQVTAQAMFPHYFEKYQTDGMEYTLYLGTSLVNDRVFDTFYLKNFRLWQLIMMCEIDNRMETLKPKLKNKLDITQLILVHDQPLSIRFRADEKQFDVDGAYDIRYEIVKKRIDKALIKHTGERLTQPGKIAIVYNQSKIGEEYERYFDYLRAKNIIKPQVEHLELEELPGATGLKALRIEIQKPEKSSIVPKNDLLKNIGEALSVQ